MLELLLLGPFEARAGGDALPIHRQKQRALAAALALRPGRPISAERLVDDLWGDAPPRKARDALQNYVSQLRRLLGTELVSTQAAGYALEVEAEQVDVFRFERLVAEARGMPAAEREAKLRHALSLVRGPPLADLALEPFASPEIVRLEELEAAVREELVAAELELGWHADVIPELEALIVRYPYREHLRAQLMLALFRAGRQADALETYRQARRVLVAELGLEPSEELQQLEGAILRHDEALRAPPRQERAELETRVVWRRDRATRKIVTVIFATLVDRGGSSEESDPESAHERRERHLTIARDVVERHGGDLERTAGEEMVAVFGLPAVHEDDALRAVRAAVELRDGIADVGSELTLGVSTDEAFVMALGGNVTGPAVAAAERLEREAAPGEIAIGAATQELVRDAVVLEPLVHGDGFRVARLVPEHFRRRLRLDAPMVGRERQLSALMTAYEGAVADGTCHLFTILGSAGVGKSRLARELVDALEGACVLQGRCPAYGEGVTFLPLLEVARQAAPVSEAVADRARAVERAEETGSLGELRAASSALFAEVSRALPLVVVLDDLHWAQPSFLDVVEHVAESVRGAPTLLLCLARPELLEERPAWAGGKPNASTILLEPLTDEETEKLLDHLLVDSDLPQPVRAHIVGGAEGNPLFVEELLTTLVEREVLQRTAGRWTTSKLVVPKIPPSIHALLAARIDRLPDDERIVLELASVEGTIFRRQTLDELLPKGISTDIDVALAALVRKELVRPVASEEPGFRFRHQLVRVAAYDSMPKRLRADFHERYAQRMERYGHVPDIDEIVGYHLERAARYLLELGPADEAARTLAMRAAERLTSAARHASARGDTVASARLLRQATDLQAA